MTISHHPNDDMLMRYAAATLGEGPSIVIGVHLTICTECRVRVDAFETLGGAVLETLEPVKMVPDAFAEVLRRIDSEPARPRIAAVASADEIAPGLAAPEAMRGLAIGPWRFLAPGLKISRVTSADRDMNLFMLRAQACMSLFEHGHTGDEYICVLKGAFTDQEGLHRPGDMAIADAGIAHQPHVEKDGECICLVALDGKLKLNSLMGRVLQPVFGL